MFIPDRPKERKMPQPPEFIRNTWGNLIFLSIEMCANKYFLQFKFKLLKNNLNYFLLLLFLFIILSLSLLQIYNIRADNMP